MTAIRVAEAAIEPGVGPGEKPSPELGPYGCMRRADDQSVADAIIGHHAVGSRRDAAEVRQRFRWVMGIREGNNAELGAAWEMFRSRSRLIALRFVPDQGLVYERVRQEPYDWEHHVERVHDPHAHDRQQAMASADAKAQRVLTRTQEEQVKRLIREAIGR